MIGKTCGVIPNDKFKELMESLSEKAEKIIITNVHRGDFEYVLPKQTIQKSNPKHKQKTIDGSKGIPKDTPYYKLGTVVVSEVVFEEEKDFRKGLLPVFPYQMITILWKTKEKTETNRKKRVKDMTSILLNENNKINEDEL